MTQDRPKTARDEALEMAKAKLPTHDPQHEHERIVDTALRMLGVTPPAQTVPHEKPHEDADGDAQQDVVGPPEMLGGPAVNSGAAAAEPVSIEGPSLDDLPTELADSEDSPSIEISDADADMPGNQGDGQPPPVKPAVPLPGPRIDPPEQVRITDIVSQITDNMDAAIAWNEPGQAEAEAALDEIRSLYKQVPSWPFPEEDSRPVAPPITIGPGPIDPPGKIEQLPYRPSEDAGARPELLADASPAHHSENESASATSSAPEFPSVPKSQDSESDRASRPPAALPPWPVLIVELEHPDQLIRPEMDVLAAEVEQLAGDIAQKRIDDYTYRQFAQQRALYWDR